jgi:hypothetical protein
MFTVKKKPLTANTLWDGENNKPLCRFSKGVFQTEDKELAEKLKTLGYEVEGEDVSESEETSESEEIAPVQPAEETAEETVKPRKGSRK